MEFIVVPSQHYYDLSILKGIYKGCFCFIFSGVVYTCCYTNN